MADKKSRKEYGFFSTLLFMELFYNFGDYKIVV